MADKQICQSEWETCHKIKPNTRRRARGKRLKLRNTELLFSKFPSRLSNFKWLSIINTCAYEQHLIDPAALCICVCTHVILIIKEGEVMNFRGSVEPLGNFGEDKKHANIICIYEILK